MAPVAGSTSRTTTPSCGAGSRQRTIVSFWPAAQQWPPHASAASRLQPTLTSVACVPHALECRATLDPSAPLPSLPLPPTPPQPNLHGLAAQLPCRVEHNDSHPNEVVHLGPRGGCRATRVRVSDKSDTRVEGVMRVWRVSVSVLYGTLTPIIPLYTHTHTEERPNAPTSKQPPTALSAPSRGRQHHRARDAQPWCPKP
jgi:hypothetical protein